MLRAESISGWCGTKSYLHDLVLFMNSLSKPRARMGSRLDSLTQLLTLSAQSAGHQRLCSRRRARGPRCITSRAGDELWISHGLKGRHDESHTARSGPTPERLASAFLLLNSFVLWWAGAWFYTTWLIMKAVFGRCGFGVSAVYSFFFGALPSFRMFSSLLTSRSSEATIAHGEAESHQAEGIVNKHGR